MNAKQKLHQTNLATWIARFKEQSESGLTIKAWCQENSISFHAYNYWKHLAKESYVDSMMPDIVPLGIPKISDTPQALPVATAVHSEHDSSKLHESRAPKVNPFSISLGDIRIEIGSGASDDMIAGIIKAVRHA